jgi:hypothetical protein
MIIVDGFGNLDYLLPIDIEGIYYFFDHRFVTLSERGTNVHQSLKFERIEEVIFNIMIFDVLKKEENPRMRAIAWQLVGTSSILSPNTKLFFLILIIQYTHSFSSATQFVLECLCSRQTEFLSLTIARSDRKGRILANKASDLLVVKTSNAPRSNIVSSI